MKKVLSILLALIMVLSLLPTVAMAEGPVTLKVNSIATNDSAERADNATYQTLAGAVAAAQPGDTIELMNNVTITEQLTIDKAITLDGKSMTITRTPGGTTSSDKGGILVTAGATIKDLTVSGPNSQTAAAGADGRKWDEGEFGIKFYQANGATLNNVTVKNANAGIQVNGGSVTMTGSIDVSSNEYGGIELCHDGELDISAATLKNSDETAATPVLWNDDTKGTIKQNASQPLYDKKIDEAKDHYYLNKAAKINEIWYPTLAEAVKYVENGETITLLDNITLASPVEIDNGKEFSIDLNNHTVTADLYGVEGSNSAIDVDNCKLEIKDSSDDAGGKLVSNEYGVSASNGGTITLSSGTIESGYAALSGNNTTGDMNFVINGGTLTSTQSEAIYMPGQQNLTITNGVINGGISARMGQIAISGGTVNGMTNSQEADSFDAYWNYSGSAWIGDAIYVWGGTYTSENGNGNSCNINITGGTINGNAHRAIAIYDIANNHDQNVSINISNRAIVNGDIVKDTSHKQENGNTVDSQISITGGTFSSNPIDYVAEGYAVSKNGSTYTVAAAENTAAVEATKSGDAVTISSVTTDTDATVNVIDVKSFGAESITADETTLGAVINNNASTKPVEFVLKTDTSVKFNTEAVKAIAGEMNPTGGNITLVVTPIATVTSGESTAMNTVAASNDNAKVFTLELQQSGTNLFPKSTGSTDAEATVTVPFTMPGGCNRVNVYYLNPTGTAEYVGTASTANGAATFTVKHFSSYALVPTYVGGHGGGSYTPSAAQTITTDLPAGSITKVTVDGKVIDSKYYTIGGGNVTLTDAYIKTLSNGKHTVAIENATHISKATITVNNAANAATVKSGKTGDAGILLYGALALMSVTGGAVIIGKKKKHE